jgi:hypothetical protein
MCPKQPPHVCEWYNENLSLQAMFMHARQSAKQDLVLHCVCAHKYTCVRACVVISCVHGYQGIIQAVCMYVRIFICMYTYIHTDLSLYMYMCTYLVCMHTCIHVWVYTYVIYTYMRTCTFKCMYMHVHVYTRYISKYKSAHIHARRWFHFTLNTS